MMHGFGGLFIVGIFVLFILIVAVACSGN